MGFNFPLPNDVYAQLTQRKIKPQGRLYIIRTFRHLTECIKNLKCIKNLGERILGIVIENNKIIFTQQKNNPSAISKPGKGIYLKKCNQDIQFFSRQAPLNNPGFHVLLKAEGTKFSSMPCVD